MNIARFVKSYLYSVSLYCLVYIPKFNSINFIPILSNSGIRSLIFIVSINSIGLDTTAPIKPSLAKDNVISYAQACCGTAYKFVPSYKNVTISIAFAAVDIVQPPPPAVLIAAAEPPFTAILVVIVYPPVPLFVKIIVIACPATRLLIANVDIFAVTVVVNKPPSKHLL